MKRFGITLAILTFCGSAAVDSLAQTPASGTENPPTTELLSLTKKIDEQTLKIDALSQQLLRLQQEIGQLKGGAVSPPVATAVESPSSAVQTGASHVVARGETLTSIAKMHKVGIEELQKFNHIENDRKLQIGQTLLIPGAAGATSSPRATPTPND
jgi:LysM repeat protein